MRAAARLLPLLWRRGAGQRTIAALTAAGVAVSAALALLALSVGPALERRADAIAWHRPQPAALDRATALQRTTQDHVRAATIVRVDLAAVPGATAPPTPPGLDRFPDPGAVAVSPAVRELLRAHPEDALATRYPGEVMATIGAAGLAHADDLVVVVGRTAADLGPEPSTIAAAAAEAGHDPAAGGGPGGDPLLGDVVPIAGFGTVGSDIDLAQYVVLARLAAVLLVVPTFLLVGAAARLTAAQREQRLAVLRLVGATPAAVVLLTAAETALAALAGAVAGIAAYVLVLPVAAGIPLAGGAFTPDGLRLGPAVLLGALAVVPLAAAASAVVALRQVVVGPLGVRRRSAPRRPRLLRFAVVPPAWALLVVAALDMRAGGSSTGALVGVGAVIVTLAAVGPWVAWAIGRLLAAVATAPATLLAARRLLDDPRAAYRTVSGMVLAGLTAGFLFGVLPTLDAVTVPEADRRELAVEAAGVDAAALRAAVRAADPGAVAVLAPFGGGGERAGGGVAGGVVASSVGRVEAVRSALLAAAPSSWVSSPTDGSGRARLLLDDLGRASTVMALASLAMASAATAIGGSAAILDQRVTLARLRLVGASLGALQRARRWQTLLPLVAASTGAMASGAAAGVVMLVAFGAGPDRLRAPDVGSMAVLAVAAVLAGAAVVALTRPVLVAASRVEPRG